MLFGHRINFLAKLLESLIEPFPKLTLPLLIVHLVWIIHAAPAVPNSLTCINHLRKELNVAVLLLSYHDWIFQVEMDQNHDFVFAWLKDCVFDVVEHDVDDFVSLRNEAQSVCMCFQITLGLASSDYRAHCQIGKSRDSFVFSSYKLFLLDESGLLFPLDFLLARTLTKFRDLTEGLWR